MRKANTQTARDCILLYIRIYPHYDMRDVLYTLFSMVHYNIIYYILHFVVLLLLHRTILFRKI